MSAEEEKKEDTLELYFEELGNIPYLVVKENGQTARERIPRHVWNMTDEIAKQWFMKELISKLKRKMHKQSKRLVMVEKK